MTQKRLRLIIRLIGKATNERLEKLCEGGHPLEDYANHELNCRDEMAERRKHGDMS